MLSAAGHLDISGHSRTVPVPFGQPVASYIEHFHSTASLARELMPADESAAFDLSVADIVRPFATDGILHMEVVAEVIWGHPRARLPIIRQTHQRGGPTVGCYWHDADVAVVLTAARFPGQRRCAAACTVRVC